MSAQAQKFEIFEKSSLWVSVVRALTPWVQWFKNRTCYLPIPTQYRLHNEVKTILKYYFNFRLTHNFSKNVIWLLGLLVIGSDNEFQNHELVNYIQIVLTKQQISKTRLVKKIQSLLQNPVNSLYFQIISSIKGSIFKSSCKKVKTVKELQWCYHKKYLTPLCIYSLPRALDRLDSTQSSIQRMTSKTSSQVRQWVTVQMRGVCTVVIT